MLNFHCTGFLGLPLPPQNSILEVMKSRFNHGVEQRIVLVVQPCIYFCPVFRLQGFHGGRKQQPFLLFQVLALMRDEVAHGQMETLTQEFLVCQDGVDRPGEDA